MTPHPRALREALNKTKILLLLTLLVIGACADPKDRDPDPAEQAPDPIGPELINLVGGWNYCSSGAHLYREGRALQFQCFDGEGVFVYENRGTLTPEAAATLDAEIMAADLNDTEPVNYLGSCGVADAVGVETLWVGDASVSFDQFCLIQGILPLYEHVRAFWTELGNCGEDSPKLIESFEPGCRLY